MLKTIIVIFFLLSSCVSTNNLIKDFKPDAGTILVEYQDSLLAVYKTGEKVPKGIINNLEENTWVKTANEISPNNIVIRQYCLIDLLNGTPDHYNDILRNVKTLSYNGEIWAESYSYWEYSYVFLSVWVEKFSGVLDTNNILSLIDGIKSGFVKTSYLRDSLYYPAPFGDLRDEPLNPELQSKCQVNTDSVIKHSIITINRFDDYILYTINGRPIGLNTHVPKDTFSVEVKNGMTNFKFYTGYSTKYANNKDELLDMLDIKRVNTLKSLKIK